MLAARPGHDETAQAIDRAVTLAAAGMPTPEQLEGLGGAWVGEEALAINLCCALAAPDARSAILAAVNHSGDSDSTGAICGNIVGALSGEAALPAEWTPTLDVVDIVIQAADDLWCERFETPADELGNPPDAWWGRYPGW